MAGAELSGIAIRYQENFGSVIPYFFNLCRKPLIGILSFLKNLIFIVPTISQRASYSRQTQHNILSASDAITISGAAVSVFLLNQSISSISFQNRLFHVLNLLLQ